jgi:hypothetical protein
MSRLGIGPDDEHLTIRASAISWMVPRLGWSKARRFASRMTDLFFLSGLICGGRNLRQQSARVSGPGLCRRLPYLPPNFSECDSGIPSANPEGNLLWTGTVNGMNPESFPRRNLKAGDSMKFSACLHQQRWTLPQGFVPRTNLGEGDRRAVQKARDISSLPVSTLSHHGW